MMDSKKVENAHRESPPLHGEGFPGQDGAFKARSEAVFIPRKGPDGPERGDLLSRYLEGIGPFEILSKEEQQDLAQRYREDKDQEAGRRLVLSMLKLVVKIAKDCCGPSKDNLLDLIQEGNTGLMHALEKFDPGRGVKFSYYASFWIKAYIKKYVMENRNLIKIGTSQSQRKVYYRLLNEYRTRARIGLKPDTAHLAEQLGVPEETVLDMQQRLTAREFSIDAPLGENATDSFAALIPDTAPTVDETLSREQRREFLRHQVNEFRETLSSKEEDIFDQRIWGENAVTLEQLANKYSLSRERIRQIQNGIVNKLHRWLCRNMVMFEEDYSDILRN